MLVLDMLHKETEKSEEANYTEVEINFDQENIDDSDDEAYSEDEATDRKSITYDIEKMFEIIHKRDYNKWSLSHIHNRYPQISSSAYGRTQISR